MKKALLTFSIIFAFSFFVSPVLAQYGQYGGENPSYSILIDKTVAVPNSNNTNSNNYVDNLYTSDPRFHAGNDVYFRLKVRNTSSRVLYDVWVHDYVPTYILPIEGPGTWDVNTRTISWNAGTFNIDEEKVYYLKMRVYEQNMLPSDQGLFCIVNKADAKNDKVYDDDTSQICIEKTVTGVTKVPQAGPEFGLALLSGQMLALGAGVFLKRKSA